MRVRCRRAPVVLRWVPRLDDAPVVHDDDLVSVQDGRKPVGDDGRGVVGGNLEKLGLNRPFGLGIERRRGRSSNTRIGGFLGGVRAMATRCFSPPEFEAALVTTVVCSRQKDPRRSRGYGPAWPRRWRPPSPGAAVGDVVEDQIVKQHVSCRTVPMAARRLYCVTADVLAVDPGEAPALDVVEPEQAARNGRLAGADGPTTATCVARRNVEGSARQGRRRGVVGKTTFDGTRPFAAAKRPGSRAGRSTSRVLRARGRTWLHVGERMA